MNRKPKVYSHPHFAPQKIPLGNHRLEHCQTKINTTSTSPIVLDATIVETQKQPPGIEITQSLDVGITTTRVETFIAPTMDVVRRGILNWIHNKDG